jgi:hypothetical protein
MLSGAEKSRADFSNPDAPVYDSCQPAISFPKGL